MAEIQRPRFRLTPGEQRAILIVGDLLMGVIALLGGIYFWFMVRPGFLQFLRVLYCPRAVLVLPAAAGLDDFAD